MCRTSSTLYKPSPIQAAASSLKYLREVEEGSVCFHSHLSQIQTSMESDGIRLPDIGTSEKEISELCNTGSKNVLTELAKILMLSKELLLPSDVISASITLEVECGYVTSQDLENLGLIEFAGHIPNTKKRRT